MAYYAGNQKPVETEDNVQQTDYFWQRQQHILERMKQAEDLFSEALKKQLPSYIKANGLISHIDSVKEMIISSEIYLVALGPHIKERPEIIKDLPKDDPQRKKTGTETLTYKTYLEIISHVQNNLNLGSRLGLKSGAGENRINEAMTDAKELFMMLREDSKTLGFDFKKARDAYEAWQR